MKLQPGFGILRLTTTSRTLKAPTRNIRPCMLSGLLEWNNSRKKCGHRRSPSELCDRGKMASVKQTVAARKNIRKAAAAKTKAHFRLGLGPKPGLSSSRRQHGIYRMLLL